MNTKTFNENFTLDRKTRADVRANPKHAPAEPPKIQTADGTAYDANETYHFFDTQTQAVRQSLGLRRDGDYLCTFGLRVVAVSNLRLSQNDALADGQAFFKLQIENLRDRIQKYELEKSANARSLKSFLMANE